MVSASAAASAVVAWFMGLTGFAFFVVMALLVLKLGLFFYGVARAFNANVLLGVVVLFFFPVGFIIGLVYAVTGRDLAQWFVNLLSGTSNP